MKRLPNKVRAGEWALITCICLPALFLLVVLIAASCRGGLR